MSHKFLSDELNNLFRSKVKRKGRKQVNFVQYLPFFLSQFLAGTLQKIMGSYYLRVLLTKYGKMAL